eukprot:m.293715 g.293715  ORF g.293715 m.293715 type:complete len:654 (-) comp27144_c0_seq20:180-2141(-)
MDTPGISYRDHREAVEVVQMDCDGACESCGDTEDSDFDGDGQSTTDSDGDDPASEAAGAASDRFFKGAEDRKRREQDQLTAVLRTAPHILISEATRVVVEPVLRQKIAVGLVDGIPSIHGVADAGGDGRDKHEPSVHADCHMDTAAAAVDHRRRALPDISTPCGAAAAAADVRAALARPDLGGLEGALKTQMLAGLLHRQQLEAEAKRQAHEKAAEFRGRAEGLLTSSDAISVRRSQLWQLVWDYAESDCAVSEAEDDTVFDLIIRAAGTMFPTVDDEYATWLERERDDVQLLWQERDPHVESVVLLARRIWTEQAGGEVGRLSPQNRRQFARQLHAVGGGAHGLRVRGNAYTQILRVMRDAREGRQPRAAVEDERRAARWRHDQHMRAQMADYATHARMQRWAFRQPHDAQPVTGTCAACLEPDVQLLPSRVPRRSESFQETPCSHTSLCQSCVSTWIKVEVDSHKLTVRCPHEGCHHGLSAADVDRLADAETAAKFRTNSTANYAANAAELLAAEPWLAKVTQPCPSCSQLCQKDGGCSTVQCLCGHRFQYDSHRQVAAPTTRTGWFRTHHAPHDREATPIAWPTVSLPHMLLPRMSLLPRSGFPLAEFVDVDVRPRWAIAAAEQPAPRSPRVGSAFLLAEDVGVDFFSTA